MDNKTQLINIGLSETEASIYLSLLRIGGSSVSKVAQDVGIKRTTIYPILKKMIEKGFATAYYKKNKPSYYAQRPHRVAAYFKKKFSAFENIIPALESIEQKQAQAFGLRFIETKDELKNFYVDIITEYKNKSYSIIGSAGDWEHIDPEFFIQYRKDRARAGIQTRLLLTAESRNISPNDQSLLRTVHFLPKKYTFRSTIDIYDDKVLILSHELTSLAVVIAIPAMVDVFKSIFEILWENVSNLCPKLDQ